MEISITKISSNGQVVIPSEVRKDAQIKPETKFLVINDGGNILLKQLDDNTKKGFLKLMEKIQKSEDQIKKGKSVIVDSKMSDDQIDDMLMS